MANVVWPDTLCPRTFSLKLLADTRASGSVYGGSEIVNDLADDTWVATMEVDSRSGDTGAALEALVNYLQGGIHTVEFGHFARARSVTSSEPVDGFLVLNETALVLYSNLVLNEIGLVLYGTPVPPTTANTLSSNALKGSDTIIVTSVVGQTVFAGDMLGVGGLLLQCAETVTAIDETVEIVLANRLRKSLPAGTRVSFDNPRIKWRLDVASQVTSFVGYTGPVSLSFVEDI